jgi:hypothetical protein
MDGFFWIREIGERAWNEGTGVKSKGHLFIHVSGFMSVAYLLVLYCTYIYRWYDVDVLYTFLKIKPGKPNYFPPFRFSVASYFVSHLRETPGGLSVGEKSVQFLASDTLLRTLYNSLTTKHERKARV